MSILQNFPVVSQLTPISWDGTSPNAQFDCVPSCLCAGCMYLNDIKQVDKQYDPDRFLDAAYPEGYHGGTDAANYVRFCATLGVHLFPVNGDAAQQVAQVHQLLAKDSPVVITMADPYVPASYGWTHAVIAHRDVAGEITVLDPYIAKNVTHSDAEWGSLIRGNVLWAMERIDDMAITINSPGVSNYFSEQPDGSWLCKQTGKVLAHGMLSFYERTNGLLVYGLPITSELPVETINPPAFEKYAGHGITLQFFERGILVYDEGHLLDFPPGAGSVYPAHLYTPGAVGTDPRLYTLQKQLQAAQTGAGASTADPRIADYQGRLKQINTLSAV